MIDSNSEKIEQLNKTSIIAKIPWRWLKYLLVCTIANGGLWFASLYYLKTTAPTYTSQATTNVAGNAPGVSVNLPEIGQAYTSGGSGFSSSSSDPRENYKFIASSESIIEEAAEELKMTPEEFGKPSLEILNNTTLLSIEMDGDSPEIAQEKVQVLYQVFHDRIQELRKQERIQREKSSESALQNAQTKLTEAQRKLSDYKAESNLHSSEQISQLISNIETLRQQKADAFAKQQETASRLRQLSLDLEISSQQAATAFVLQTDQQFQEILKQYNTVITKLEQLLSYRGENYPDVVKAKEEKETIEKMLLQRGEILLGKAIALTDLENLGLDNSNGSGEKRAELFQQLITLKSNSEGLNAKVLSLNQEIQLLEIKLQNLSKKEAVLDTLLRELQIAEAIFASTLTKVDLSRGDAFGSFPLIQIVEEATLPVKPSSPKKNLVLAGTVLGSLLITSSLTLLWWRNFIVKLGTKMVVKILE